MTSRRLSRRDLLRTTAATAAGAGLPLAVSRAAPAQDVSSRTTGRKPRSIIFMVSDGMSAGVPTLAEPFSQLVRGRGTAWTALAARPGTVHGLQDTAALNGMVPDSASAASAWGSGSRIFNGVINVLPDGRRLTPIAPLARQRGKLVGLVTTCTVTHATPAGFAAVQEARQDEQVIAGQYLDVVDVILGGGRKFFEAATRPDGRDLTAEFERREYSVWRTRDDLLKGGASQRALGLFGSSHLPYTIDHQRDGQVSAEIPTLAEMTQSALAALDHGPDGFLLQVEGGRIDHAAHNNDAAAMLWDQLAFDDAIAVVLEYQQAHPDTLIIITTDHGNANPGLNGVGTRYRRSDECFARLAQCTASYDVMSRQLRNLAHEDVRPAIELVIDEIGAATKVMISGSDAEAIAGALAREPLCELNQQHANVVGTVGQVLGNHTGIGWTGTTHTSDLVMLMAVGPGAERFAGLTLNTDVYTILADLMGITHRNPSMTPEEAKSFASAKSVDEVQHWT